MSCTVIPNHCHLRVIMMGTWEAGSHGKPHLGHRVPPHPQSLTVTLRPGLGAVTLRISTLCPSWSPPLGFSAKAGGFIYAFLGLAPPAPPWGPWDLWAGVWVLRSLRMEERGEGSGQVKRASWLERAR